MHLRFSILAAAVALLGAGPGQIAPFPPATSVTLPNGAIVAFARTAETPLVGVQVFLPAGLAQQRVGQAGVAAVTAAMVLQTAVEGGAGIAAVAQQLGAGATYTIDQQDTRFYLEAKAADMPRLLRDLSSAIARPDAAKFDAARAAALTAATEAVRDPAVLAYSMIRQVEYDGTGFAHPEGGRPIQLAALAPADTLAFAAQYRHGAGTIVALSGNATDDAVAAAKAAVSGFAAAGVPAAPMPTPIARGHEIVAHRDVASPWVAIGYAVPSQYSPDFPAMLVIEALLGRGGDVHAFSFGPDAQPPEEYIGGYYQYEAQPGAFVEFYSGANIDQDMRNLAGGIARLRGGKLPADVVDRARSSALGSFLTSVTTLDDQSWLLGRAVQSPLGASFENVLPQRIAAVSAADIQRVARKYLGIQTVAVVLPNGIGQ